MAADTRTIVYHKGKPYFIKKDEGGILIELEDTTNEKVTKLVSKDTTLTEEEFSKLKDSRRSPHVNWINPN